MHLSFLLNKAWRPWNTIFKTLQTRSCGQFLQFTAKSKKTKQKTTSTADIAFIPENRQQNHAFLIALNIKRNLKRMWRMLQLIPPTLGALISGVSRHDCGTFVGQKQKKNKTAGDFLTCRHVLRTEKKKTTTFGFWNARPLLASHFISLVLFSFAG